MDASKNSTLTMVKNTEKLLKLVSSYKGKYIKINTMVDFGSEGELLNCCFT